MYDLKRILSFHLLMCSSLLFAEWPQFTGPNGDFSTTFPFGDQPATKASHLRHIWDSEAMVGATGLSRQQMPSGGAATPIVYQDRIYLWYFSPNISEGIFDPNPSTRKVPKEIGSWSHLYRVLDNAVSSDQHIICINAKTGKTMWRRSFPATGLTQNGHKDGLNNMTMAAGEGKVFAFGSGRHLYCLDAKTGALHWRVRYPNFHGFQKTRTELLGAGRQFKRSRDGNNYLVLVDGVLVSGGNDNGSQLAAFDAETGEQLWRNGGWISGRASPKVWRQNGKGYLLTAAHGRVGLIEPRSGEFLWKLEEGMASPGSGFSIQGDLFFTNRGEPKGSEVTNGHLACFRLSLEGAELLWEADEVDGFPTAKNQGIFVHNGVAFMRSLNAVHLYEVSSGKKLDTLSITDGGNDDTAIVFRINNLLYQVIDSQHLHYPTVVIDMESRSIVGKFTIHHPGISYSSQMLPVFHGNRMILRRGYCRISAFTFTAEEPAGFDVKINEPIVVVATGESATFTAFVTGEASQVRWLLDGKEVARSTEAPFTATIQQDTAGCHQIQAFAVSADGAEAESFQKLLSVVDWEVMLLPRSATLEMGQPRRFIPLAVDQATGDLLPQRFQAVRMSQNLDNTWPNPFSAPSKELQDQWHERVGFEVSGGAIHTTSDNLSNPEDTKTPWSSWGLFRSAEPGTHTVTARLTHNGMTRASTSEVRVRATDERLPQQFLMHSPLPTFVLRKSGSARPRAALSSGHAGWAGKKSSGVTLTVVEGPAKLRGKNDGMTPTAAGVITFGVSHPGNERYLPIEEEHRRFLVIKPGAVREPHQIEFASIADQSPDAGPLSLEVSSPSEVPPRLSVISGPATIDGTTLILEGEPGVVTVIAEHEGDMTYAPALPVVQEFHVR